MRLPNPIGRHVRETTGSRSATLCLLLSLLVLFACGDSSETRNTTKNSSSSETELKVSIVSPADGSTVAFTTKTGKEDEGPTAEAEFWATEPLGGTKPYGVTFLSEGPTTSNSGTGLEDSTILVTPEGSTARILYKAELTFLESGIHKITAVARDSRGFTASDSITITVVGSSG